MALIDELDFQIKAGKGGNGVVRFRREKHKPNGGPSGGNGGKGGDVYVEAVRDSAILAKYKFKKEFFAENGVDGGSNSLYGKNGEDLIIKMPIGTLVTRNSTGEQVDLLEEGERVLILKGGNGGLGNEHFKSSVNQTPKESTKGKPGEEGKFKFELRLIADAGLVGFPNAGKSSILNVLTNAESKVASYSFTTVSPHLGDLYGYILADIPGLIEGASLGKGLGHTFLKHISRTKLILHCISLESEDVPLAYEIIRKELSSHSKDLDDKEEVIILTKTDLVEEKSIEDVKKSLAPYGRDILTVSIYDDESIKILSDSLVKKMSEM